MQISNIFILYWLLDIRIVSLHLVRRWCHHTVRSLAYVTISCLKLHFENYDYSLIQWYLHLLGLQLFVTRMQIIGIPRNIIELVEIWLRDRNYFITCRGKNSFIKMSNIGTDHPGLNTWTITVFYICLSALWPHSISDVTQVIIDRKIEGLETKMQIKLEMMTKWLKHSGLIVNKSKQSSVYSIKLIITPLT